MTETAVGLTEVRDLSKSYGPIAAVRDLSLDLHAGEIVGLLGPNGAGKTTTIECLLGLRRPDRGSFRIGNVDAFARPRAARRLIGAQLQSSALPGQITVREALILTGAFHEDPIAPDALLDQFELQPMARARFDSLSGGQKQRLLLALAFVHRPALLLLDEPTAGLDPAARRDLHRFIARQREEGRAVLLSTHYLEEAAQLCDRVAIIDQGKIVACAAPQQLVARAKSQPRIRLRTAGPLDLAGLAELADAATSTPSDHGVTTVVRTSDVGASTTALVQAIERSGNSLLDLQIERPTLEDVFLELTGKPWSSAAREEVA